MPSPSMLNSQTIQDTMYIYISSLVYITFHFSGISFFWEKCAVRISRNPEQSAWETLLNTASYTAAAIHLLYFKETGIENRRESWLWSSAFPRRPEGS